MNLCNNLLALGVNIVEHTDEQSIHTSGHPARPALREMYKLLRPKVRMIAALMRLCAF